MRVLQQWLDTKPRATPAKLDDDKSNIFAKIIFMSGRRPGEA